MTTIEKFFENKMGNRHMLCAIAVKRARELAEGSPSLIEDSWNKKPVTLAVEELLSNKWVIPPSPQTILKIKTNSPPLEIENALG